MTCQSCGREAENGVPAHWLGCAEAAKRWAGAASEKQGPVPLGADLKPDALCEHGGCSQPKKEWSGKGAKPKYCAAGHKKEK